METSTYILGFRPSCSIMLCKESCSIKAVSVQILDHLQLETNGGRIEGSFQWIYPDFDRHNFTWQDAEVKSFKLLSSNLAGTPPIGTEQL